VHDLLQDDPELLALADAIASTRRSDTPGPSGAGRRALALPGLLRRLLRRRARPRT
jgi:hypothetical protein